MTEFSAAASVTRVHVRDLPILAQVGVNRGEIGCKQPLIISVDLTLFGRTIDRLEETVDYRVVVKAAERLAREHIPLIETFARRLGEDLLRLSAVEKAEIRVDKPFALQKGTASVSMSLERGGVKNEHLNVKPTG